MRTEGRDAAIPAPFGRREGRSEGSVGLAAPTPRRQEPPFEHNNRTPHSALRTPHSAFCPPHSALRTCRAFTMIEIAISLAVIGFALVAIIGVLPIGMNVQKDNREDTIINQDATVFMNAIRNGAQGLDDLTNYVMAITNTWTQYYLNMGVANGPHQYGYTTTNSFNTGSQYPLINGFRIVGLLSTPKYVFLGGFCYSNHVVAYVRSISGAASDKFPQNNPSMQDLAFSYRLTSEVIPCWTNYFDPSWGSQVVNNLSNNLHDVRLYFRWPLQSQGRVGQTAQSFRALAGGFILETNEFGFARSNPNQPSPYDLYFFQPQSYVNAQ